MRRCGITVPYKMVVVRSCIVSDNEEENTFMMSAADEIVEMVMARTSHTGGIVDLSESLDNLGLDSMEWLH